MEFKDLRKQSPTELNEQLIELRREQFNLRMQKGAVQTGVNRTPSLLAQLYAFGLGGPFYDIRPSDVARSLLIARMTATQAPLRMPRLGSNRPDPDGIRVVSAWIAAMTAQRGYPSAAP